MYAERNIQARWCNHCCNGKAISITYSECVFTALGNQHAMCMRPTVIRCLPRSTVFYPHYLINGTTFGKKVLNTKCVFRFSVQLLSETFLIPRRTGRDMIKNVYRSSCKVHRWYCCQILLKLEFSRHIFQKYSNIKLHENPSGGSRVVPCG